MTAFRALAAVNRTVKLLAPALALSISASVPAPAKADYLAFLRTSIPSTWTVDAPHLRLIADHLDKIENGDIDRLAIHMPPRHGKPVYNGSMVLMGNGSRKPIAEIVVGEFVITGNGRPRQVSAVFEQGLLDCVEITTRRGRVTKAALTHPFLTPYGWVKAGDLVVGDILATVPCPCTDSEEASFDLARMAGYFVGDGATGGTNKGKGFNAKITCADPETAEDFIATAARVGWGCTVRKPYQDRPALDYSFTGGVRDWLREVGLAYKVSRTKRVPEFVMRGNAEIAAEFLAAYFLCDGTINARGGKRQDCCVEWASVNLDLLKDTQHLLLRLGVQSTLRTRTTHTKWSPPEGTVSSRLSVSTVDDCARLMEALRLVGPKDRRLKEWNPKRSTFGLSRYRPMKSLKSRWLVSCLAGALPLRKIILLRPTTWLFTIPKP